ncbi:MAG: class II aldolase/adducin family protein [Phycisphaerae bacterium]|nr:class II aldolase/adducin family protein [Phycisphaerae bacterium]
MNSNEWELKKQIVDIAHKLWELRFVAANDGNISIKMNDREVLTTPTGISKGSLTVDMIIKTDMKGKPITFNSKYKPSSEVKMHIEVYEQRSDVKSIVHAHPPFCTSFAVAGIPLDKCILPEAILTLGAVPITPYGMPSTMEIPDAIRPYIQNTDAVLLANHGALTMGHDLTAAYYRMETLEHSAHILYRAMQLGNINQIAPSEIVRLMQLRKDMNIPGKIQEPTKCMAGGDVSDAMIDEITRKVMEKVRNSR